MFVGGLVAFAPSKIQTDRILIPQRRIIVEWYFSYSHTSSLVREFVYTWIHSTIVPVGTQINRRAR